MEHDWQAVVRGEGVNLPASHGVHALAFAPDENCPGWHSTHDRAPVLVQLYLRPAEHRHADRVDPGRSERESAGQSTHWPAG